MKTLKRKVTRSYRPVPTSPDKPKQIRSPRRVADNACTGRKKKACNDECIWAVGEGCYNKKPSKYFKKKMTLDEERQKFCRCIMHVMKRGHPNPYAVCARSVGTTTGGKSCQYNLKSIPLSEVKAYMLHLHNTGKLSKSNMSLQRLLKWYAK